MRTAWTMFVMTGLGAALVACGSSDPSGSESAAGGGSNAGEPGGEVPSAASASTASMDGVATSAGMVEFAELRCIYRQSTGASDDLELQLLQPRLPRISIEPSRFAAVILSATDE